MMKKVLMVFVFANIFANCNAGECPAEAPRHAPHAITGETCPYIGKMGNYKLAIPKHYILGPDFVYEGDDIWRPNNFRLNKTQSFNSTIEYFSIKVRLKDFKGIETKADFEEYSESDQYIKRLPPRDRQWIAMTIRAATKSSNPSDIKKRTLHGFLSSISRVDMATGKITLAIQKTKVMGLDHYLSPLPPSHDGGYVNEMFYDQRSERSVITCQNVLQVNTNRLLSHCNHHFINADDNIYVDIGGIEDKEYYLSRWPDVERGILKVFHSFIVQ